jgi:peptidoglycan/xylan/chitin deacetylase (PgdA/CDA1 family)
VYLTFDDGPTPYITNKVLDILNQYNAKATFFCLGRKVREFPELFEIIKSAGHSAGSHGYDHFNGFTTPLSLYLENTDNGIQVVNSNLFRPPYGKITLRQIAGINPLVKIVMWSIMSRDFDNNTNASDCLDRVIKNIYPGSVILFHDTVQASENLFYILPKVLDYLAKNDYISKEISIM